MNNIYLGKLVTALRSGKYKQTKYRMQYKDAYCILGIACKLFIDGIEYDKNGAMIGIYPYEQSNSPAWLKALNNDFKIRTGHSLAELNDTKGLTFEQIADIIEATYLLRR